MNKILIISLQGLGNTVMLTPILKYLDEQNKVRISLALSNNGSYQYIKALNLKIVEKINVWNEKESSIHNIIRLARQLRKDKFDVVYATYPSAKRENTLLFLSRAKKNVLRCHKGFFKLWEFLNPMAKVADYTLHDIENNALLFGVPISEINKRETKINFSGEIVVGLHVGSKALSKRWEIDKYAKLMQMLKSSFQCKFVLIGGKDEMNLINAIKNITSLDFEVLSGVDFEELIPKISSLTLLICNDSSIVHISAFLGIPTIVIWSWAQFWRVSPYGKGNIVIKKNYNCIPCYDFTKKYISDCQYHLRCIKDIKVEEVYLLVKTYILSLQSHRIPCVDDFREIEFLSEIKSLRNGCLILSLKGDNN